MPRGKGRREAPPGYMTPAEAAAILGPNRLYRFVKDGKIKRYAPEGYTHGFYKKEDIEARHLADTAFDHANGEKDIPVNAIFQQATLADMDALYKMASKPQLFPKTADAERRRTWLRKEPEGHYIVKRTADGACMAYMYLLPFKTEYLSAYLHDELPSREITPDHIEPFHEGVPAQATVIGGIGSDPDVPQELRSMYTAMLLRGVRKDMGRLGRQGIIFPRLYAFSERPEGIAMCARLGMEQIEPPRGKWCMFEFDVEQSNAPILRDYKQGLAEWKALHNTTV